jgi:hypothetical protein
VYYAWAYSHDWFEQRKWADAGAASPADYMHKHWNNEEWDGYDLLALAWTVRLSPAMRRG